MYLLEVCPATSATLVTPGSCLAACLAEKKLLFLHLTGSKGKKNRKKESDDGQMEIRFENGKESHESLKKVILSAYHMQKGLPSAFARA
ncbi:hypothetical protein CDV31_007979 [Fusarium ambrosium]|uniref:Uncharacterized protein n=1 Tax=Fusarium ambrosium TaxID=131363 RepID=A0A428U3E1_9HYPO|nr:hypothetical protein CDV31_007979 [Fusarium ambrosium]